MNNIRVVKETSLFNSTSIKLIGEDTKNDQDEGEEEQKQQKLNQEKLS